MHAGELAAVAAAIGGLFASAEMLRRRGVSTDATRRYTHATGATIAAMLPAFLSLGEYLGLALVVAAFLAWTRMRGMLSSVHAATVGDRIPSARWRVWRGTKSLSGSLAFIGVALLIGLVAAAWSPIGLGPIVATAVILAVVEGSLGFGLDNLALPPIAVLSWRAVVGP